MPGARPFSPNDIALAREYLADVRTNMERTQTDRRPQPG
jgi:hypothetical protein